MSNFIKILPASDEMLHTDGQTEMANLIAAFRKFANASKHAIPHSRFPQLSNYKERDIQAAITTGRLWRSKGFMNEMQVIFDASFKFYITNTTPNFRSNTFLCAVLINANL